MLLSIKATEISLAPLWEDICKQIRPQRKKNANTWSDFLTRLRWMRCITRTLFHIFANAKGAELMTQLLLHLLGDCDIAKRYARVAQEYARLAVSCTDLDAAVQRAVDPDIDRIRADLQGEQVEIV